VLYLLIHPFNSDKKGLIMILLTPVSIVLNVEHKLIRTGNEIIGTFYSCITFILTNKRLLLFFFSISNYFLRYLSGFIDKMWLLGVSESALRFDGKSYLKYVHRMDEDSHDFRLSLKFRTFREQGLIMSTNGANDWGALQVFIPHLWPLNQFLWES